MARLESDVENLKIMLSSNFFAPFKIESAYNGLDFDYSLTRSKFEELNDDLFRIIVSEINKVIRSIYRPEPLIYCINGIFVLI
jgi:molecular chaperone DnaK (HSP70)